MRFHLEFVMGKELVDSPFCCITNQHRIGSNRCWNPGSNRRIHSAEESAHDP